MEQFHKNSEIKKIAKNELFVQNINLEKNRTHADRSGHVTAVVWRKCGYIYTSLFWQRLHGSVGSLFAFPCGCAIGNVSLEHLIMPIISAFAQQRTTEGGWAVAQRKEFSTIFKCWQRRFYRVTSSPRYPALKGPLKNWIKTLEISLKSYQIQKRFFYC